MKETVEAKLNFFERMNSIGTKHLDLIYSQEFWSYLSREKLFHYIAILYNYLNSKSDAIEIL